MARIADEELSRIKSEISVEGLAEAAGVALRRHGSDLIGLCPFHDDHEPSLVITPRKNLWHCLGACQAGGSVIDWVMRREGVSFRHAVEILRADRLVPPIKRQKRTPKTSSVTRLPAPVALDSNDAELLADVVDYYHQTLADSPEALAYLEKRGIADAKAVERFKIGFANRTLGYRVPKKNRAAGAELRGRLAALGIIRDSGHEHFNGSVTFPVTDEAGRVVEIYGRKIRDDLRPGTPTHLYLPGPHAGVWNLAGTESAEDLVLTESIIDALTFYCAGFTNTTASYGTAGFTDDHLEAFLSAGTKRVLIAYDRDEAGDVAAAELATRLEEAGIASMRVLFPKGMDANGYATKVTPAAKSLGLVIEKAIWLSSGGEVLPPSPPEISRGEEGVIPPLAAKAADDSAPVAPKAELPQPELECDVSETEIAIRIADRRYRVRGLAKNAGLDSMRVNLMASNTSGLHVDVLDLYQARARDTYVRAAATELGAKAETISKDLGRVLLKLEELQADLTREALAPRAEAEMSETDRRDAMELLSDPQLIDRVRADLDRLGVVGESENKLICYLAAISRKLSDPLAVVIQSSSAAGKSSLFDAVLSLVPEEEKVVFSAMTGQSLFYVGSGDLSHKVLAVAEEEGAERAAYSLKLLQSEGELRLASVGKDPETGKHLTHEYVTKGPVAIFLTTTSAEIEDEFLSRSVVLSVTEDRAQTRAIQAAQREAETLEGLVARRERAGLLALHKNAQRLLEPIAVVNPYARELKFRDDKTRTRRDQKKYLALIRAIALLHQHQREKKFAAGADVAYIEATRDDISLANSLCHTVFGRSLDDLSPQARRLLSLIDEMVAARAVDAGYERSAFRFTRRDVREATGWSDFSVRTHLGRLCEMEYVIAHRGRRGLSFEYELLYDAESESEPRLFGLIDPESVDSHHYDAKFEGPEGRFEGPDRKFEVGSSPQRDGFEPTLRLAQEPDSPSTPRVSGTEAADEAQTSRGAGTDTTGSHVREAAGASG